MSLLANRSLGYRYAPIEGRGPAEEEKIKIQIQRPLLEKIAAVFRFAILVIPSAILSLLTVGKWNFLLIEARQCHHSLLISNKRVAAIAKKIFERREQHVITTTEALQELDQAKKELTTGWLGKDFHNADALAFLKSARQVVNTKDSYYGDE